jgi:hypothetical protein
MRRRLREGRKSEKWRQKGHEERTMSDRYDSTPVRGGMNEMDQTRQDALDAITSAFAHGRITIEDYEARAEKIQKAKLPVEIDAQTLGLPRPELPREAPEASSPRRAGIRSAFTRASVRRPDAAPARDLFVEERHGSPDFSLCVMGERKLAGDWLNSDQATSFTLMGSTTLDLSNTALPPGRLKIDAIAVMGEIRILVPRGLPVRMSAFPFMGEANVHASVEQRVDRGQPWVDVSGIAFMGSIIVKAV